MRRPYGTEIHLSIEREFAMSVPVAGLLNKAVALAKNPAVQEAAVKAAKKAWNHKDEIKEAAVVATPYVKKSGGERSRGGFEDCGCRGRCGV